MARPTRAAATKARAATRRNVPSMGSGSESDEYEVRETSPSPSIISVSSGSDESIQSERAGTKRKRPAKAAKRQGKPSVAAEAKGKLSVADIEDCVPRPHGASYHSIAGLVSAQGALLDWFDTVRDERRMPWRKRYDPGMSAEGKAQRAYEVWVSEVMLQQTQVSTVIDYWTRWVARWPSIGDLARADIEEVNAAWRGLGYYRRARSLLEGAKVVVEKYDGRLPDDPEVLEKGIPGVGRYTAGAICSIAYGIRTPIVDGNIHRVLARVLAIHANQTSPRTIKFLWAVAEELVDALPKRLNIGIAGDWNQALMELGATICKPVNPDCAACPISSVCAVKKEVEGEIPQGSDCDLCEPLPALAVSSFPMKKVKKASREENEIVVVVEWRGEGETKWLLSKRPEKGLLAGLFEPPTIAVSSPSLSVGKTHVQSLVENVKVVSHESVAPVTHIFSHINMTYHAQHMVVTSATIPILRNPTCVWLDAGAVERANVGTGVKKVWAAVYGKWGNFKAPCSTARGVRAKAKSR